MPDNAVQRRTASDKDFERPGPRLRDTEGGIALLAGAALFVSSIADGETLVTLLNSERIEQEFGSSGIDVLGENGAVRVSSLYSVEAGSRVTRTLAIVKYSHATDPRLHDEHRQILRGGSIGAVMRSAGWNVHKCHAFFGELDPEAASGVLWSRMGGIEPRPLALHVYELVVESDGHAVHYATIAEAHHPEYIDISGLSAMYPETFPLHRNPEAAADMLAIVNRHIEKL